MKCVFDKILDRNVRKSFLLRKESSYNTSEEELAQLNNFILSDECTRGIERLRDGDHYFDIPRLIRLRKINSDKRRQVYKFHDDESMILKLMAFVLHDYDDLFSDSLYSFRLGKHVSEIFNTIRRNGFSVTHWVIKADIKGFGDHVVPDILDGQLKKLFFDEDKPFYEFLSFLLLRGEYYDKGILCHGSTGALSGCALTNFFENIYLLDVDDVLIENSAYYCRFADDIAVFTVLEQEAVRAYTILEKMFAERGLSFNTEKTAILPPGTPFDLLGFSVEGGEFHIAETSLRKIEWKLRHYADKLILRQQKGQLTKEEAGQMMVNRINGYFFGKRRTEHEINWADWAFRILTKPDSLERLDLCAQDCIRIVGSGGKRTNAKYRVRYHDMQQMGYRTLVHAYYHGYERV